MSKNWYLHDERREVCAYRSSSWFLAPAYLSLLQLEFPWIRWIRCPQETCPFPLGFCRPFQERFIGAVTHRGETPSRAAAGPFRGYGTSLIHFHLQISVIKTDPESKSTETSSCKREGCEEQPGGGGCCLRGLQRGAGWQDGSGVSLSTVPAPCVWGGGFAAPPGHVPCSQLPAAPSTAEHRLQAEVDGPQRRAGGPGAAVCAQSTSGCGETAAAWLQRPSAFAQSLTELGAGAVFSLFWGYFSTQLPEVDLFRFCGPTGKSDARPTSFLAFKACRERAWVRARPPPSRPGPGREPSQGLGGRAPPWGAPRPPPGPSARPRGRRRPPQDGARGRALPVMAAPRVPVAGRGAPVRHRSAVT